MRGLWPQMFVGFCISFLWITTAITSCGDPPLPPEPNDSPYVGDPGVVDCPGFDVCDDPDEVWDVVDRVCRVWSAERCCRCLAHHERFDGLPCLEGRDFGICVDYAKDFRGVTVACGWCYESCWLALRASD